MGFGGGALRDGGEAGMTETIVIEEGSELQTLAAALLEAAAAYRNACSRHSFGGAVQWLDASDGFTVICTRGEYRRTLMENIERLHKEEVVATFAHSVTDANMEAEFEARTPDGLT
jgi:hypothetical protein